MAAATKPITVKLDSDTHSRIEQLADARQRSAHWMLREAIGQYVEREEKREALRRSALTAWNDFSEAGLHLDMDEADQWLAQLEDGQDVDPPQCHA